MEIQKLQREFSYNGARLPEPNEAFTLVQVRDFYATVYPEIISADIEGPKQIGAKSIYTFRRAVGTKGGGASLAGMIDDVAALLQANWLEHDDAEFIKSMQETLNKNEVVSVHSNDRIRLHALHRLHCTAAI